ncbi:heme exporter protein CcmD [Rhodoblastus sp.]|jgi:heme exporter protein CcmD|nr:heme exporter protein CcmD [Rhodoblastus sp.]
MKDYSFYIVSAYGFAAIVVGALVASITLEFRELKGKLARFDDRETGR